MGEDEGEGEEEDEEEDEEEEEEEEEEEDEDLVTRGQGFMVRGPEMRVRGVFQRMAERVSMGSGPGSAAMA